MNKKVTILISFLSVLVVLIAVSVWVFKAVENKSEKRKIEQYYNINESSVIKEDREIVIEKNVEVDVLGWHTYESYEYGYSLNYPEDWLLETENYITGDTHDFVKYVSLKKDNYLLTFSLINHGDDYGFGRGEVGPGDFIKKEVFYIDNINVEVKELVYDGSVREIFFSGSNDLYYFSGYFSYVDDAYGEDFVFDLDKFDIVKSIFKTIKFNGETYTLGWYIFGNNYFTSKYPKEWHGAYNLEDEFALFDPSKENGIIAHGVFDNENNLEVNEWVKKNNFFSLNKNQDKYIVYDVGNPTMVLTDKNIEIPVYGGYFENESFWTALIPIEDRTLENKILALSYTISSYENEDDKRNIFIDIVKKIRITEGKNIIPDSVQIIDPEKTDCREDYDLNCWSTIKIDEVGISFKLPDNVYLLGNKSIDSSRTKKMAIKVTFEEFDSIGDYPSGYGKEDALKDSELLKTGEFGLGIDWPAEDSKKVVQIGDIYAKSFMVLGRFEVCDVTFERILLFYYNGYRVIITLYGPGQSIISSMPEYFMTESYCGAVRRVENSDFYNALSNGNGSESAEEWYNVFDEIIDTIKVF